MSRNIGDRDAVPDVDSYIGNIGASVKDGAIEEPQVLLNEEGVEDIEENNLEDEGSNTDTEEVYDSEEVRQKFAEALDEYK